MDAISTEKKLLELKRIAIRSRHNLILLSSNDNINKKQLEVCNDMINMIDDFMVKYPVSDWQRKYQK